MSPKMTFSEVLYLDVLVVFPEVHQAMVGIDGMSKVSDVSADNDKVLPDLPVFVVTLQGFLQGVKCSVSASESDGEGQTGKERQ